MNINLKDGSNGIDLARDLLEELNCPSLFISGNITDARNARDVAIGFLAKPYRPSLVVESIEVAAQIINVRKPEKIPTGLELFGNPPPEGTATS